MPSLKQQKGVYTRNARMQKSSWDSANPKAFAKNTLFTGRMSDIIGNY